MLKQLSPRQTTLVVGLVALATILGAWIFEYAGYLPCELCLKQRFAYYAAIPLAFLIYATGNSRLLKSGLVLLAIIWTASAIFGFYHSGVEWGWWPGPDTCSAGSDLGSGGGLPDLSKRGVMCNEAALRIFGLSLAGWNAVISATLVWLSLRGLRHHGSSSVSQ